MQAEQSKHKIINNIGYKTYNKICEGLVVSSFFSMAGGGFIPFPYDILYYFAALGSGALGVIMSITDLPMYTKEASALRRLYSEFIDNYVKLNKTLEVEKPIEIYALYNYLLDNGYLSKNKICLTRNTVKALEINSVHNYELYGVHVINGFACCRHISTMLSSIYNAMGYDSVTVINKHYNNSLLFYNEITDDQIDKLSMRLLKAFGIKKSLQEELFLEFLDDYLGDFFYNEEYDNNEKELEKIYKLLQKSPCNHQMTFVTDKKHGYYLDSSLTKIFRVDRNNSNNKFLHLYNDDGYACAHIDLIKNRNSINTFNQVKDKFLLPSVNKDQEQAQLIKTGLKCIKNKDIFERFYIENNELYNEISNQLYPSKTLSLNKTR